jgi:ribonuclease E
VPHEAAEADSDDFGSGIADEACGFSAPAETTDSERRVNYGAADDDAPVPDAEVGSSRDTAAEGGRVAEGEESLPRKRRRRRRRRGGRGGGSAAAAAPVPESDWGDSDGPELSDTASISEESPFDDDDSNEPQDADFADGTTAGFEPEADVADGDDELGEEQTVGYENIPTWEEAISYLLHPNQVQVESGATGGGPKPPRGSQPAEQPRQTRHIGHRKHRR